MAEGQRSERREDQRRLMPGEDLHRRGVDGAHGGPRPSTFHQPRDPLTQKEGEPDLSQTERHRGQSGRCQVRHFLPRHSDHARRITREHDQCGSRPETTEAQRPRDPSRERPTTPPADPDQERHRPAHPQIEPSTAAPRTRTVRDQRPPRPPPPPQAPPIRTGPGNRPAKAPPPAVPHTPRETTADSPPASRSAPDSPAPVPPPTIPRAPAPRTRATPPPAPPDAPASGPHHHGYEQPRREQRHRSAARAYCGQELVWEVWSRCSRLPGRRGRGFGMPSWPGRAMASPPGGWPRPGCRGRGPRRRSPASGPGPRR